VRVYLALRRKLGKFNNGDINATLTEMRHAGIRSSSTLATALQRLEKLGFIEKTRQGGIANGGKLCSLFRFTDGMDSPCFLRQIGALVFIGVEIRCVNKRSPT
jgi:hypothetical protein